MATVIDVTESAHEMVRLCLEMKESGLLEQVREIVLAADPYLRRAEQATREMQPPPEHARPPVEGIDEEVRQLGSQLGEHRMLLQSAMKHASELRAYVTDLEHLWRRLSA